MAAIRILLRTGGMLAGSSAGMATQVNWRTNLRDHIFNDKNLF